MTNPFLEGKERDAWGPRISLEMALPLIEATQACDLG